MAIRHPYKEVESYISDTIGWEIVFVIFDQNVVEFMTPLLL